MNPDDYISSTEAYAKTRQLGIAVARLSRCGGSLEEINKVQKENDELKRRVLLSSEYDKQVREGLIQPNPEIEKKREQSRYQGLRGIFG